MICLPGKVKVYHITSPEGAIQLKRDGIKATCRTNIPFADILSEKRRCSNYAWADLLFTIDAILEDHPTKKPPLVAEICVDESTLVYDMTKINEGEECVEAQKSPHPHFRHLSKVDALKCLQKSVCEWKASAIPLKNYPTGLYSQPEVLFGDVTSDEINIIPMVEAPMAEGTRKRLEFFVQTVDELLGTLTPKDREAILEGNIRFQKSWDELYKERQENLKDIPLSKDIECTEEIMAWDWDKAARQYLEQAGLKPVW